MMCRIRDVADNTNGLVTDFRYGFVNDISPSSGDDNLRSLSCEQLSDCFAYAAVAAGDDGNLVFQHLHCLSPFGSRQR
jgi:hypothetical protein